MDTPGYFDTHMHLPQDTALYAAFHERAMAAGVTHLLACCSGFEDTVRAAGFAEQFEHCWFTAGIHPHESGTELTPVAEFKQFAKRRRFAAVGEIGLDYFYDISDRKTQRECFGAFLNLALELDVPAVVHCRDKENESGAYDDAYALLRDYAAAGGRFELHAYAGSLSYLEIFLELGAYFGVGGMVTFKRADNIRELVRHMPLERILLETDTPYLAPVPFRGQDNHPALLPYTAQKLAELKDLKIEECRDRTTANALRFFRLPASE